MTTPVLLPGKPGMFDEVAVKDPTIVFYGDKWHLFYSAVGRESAGTGYVAASTLDGLQTASRFELKQLRGKKDRYACAPQVFFFEPQKTWYLVYQTRDANYQPVYSVTRTIEDAKSWSAPTFLVEKSEREKWIDFWVICDDATAFFFYTRHPGSSGVVNRDCMVMTTGIDEFPRGFGSPRKAFSGVTEAVHVYKVKGKAEYHMLYELMRDNGSAGKGRRSYGLAVAKHLLGPWRIETEEYATGAQLRYEDDAPKWTEEVSHGEFIRSGHNQRLEYDPERTQFLIQGVRRDERGDSYSRLPWKLGPIHRTRASAD